MKSSPGLCQFRNYGTTNADVFRYTPETGIDPVRSLEVKTVVKYRLEQLIATKVLSDDIKVFVKPEPHKTSKLEEGRYRLISAVSLIDTLVDRVLFGWLQRKALLTVGKTPCFCGWSPIRGGWRYLRDRFLNYKVYCLDKSSWDWTVQEYLIKLWYNFIIHLAMDHRPWWRQAVKSRFTALFRDAVFQFSDGTRVAQGAPGIMKSGCFLTLLLNSVGQSFVHYLVMLRLGESPLLYQPITMGDDTVQKFFEFMEAYLKELTKLGVKVKYTKERRWVEFCGFTITNDSCTPSYWEKHLFNLCHGELAEKLASYQIMYANEPRMAHFLHTIASRFIPELGLSSVEAKQIMNAC
uniref:RNA-directed RNA polymerase C-terminal domain-containing protein n=1 Tax=Riboviria sp. TaxID=2585031 RepID=A0A8K1U2T2_9VIRU|nr:MAG: hypothetical protein 1 [Riboviria sp.]